MAICSADTESVVMDFDFSQHTHLYTHLLTVVPYLASSSAERPYNQPSLTISTQRQAMSRIRKFGRIFLSYKQAELTIVEVVRKASHRGDRPNGHECG